VGDIDVERLDAGQAFERHGRRLYRYLLRRTGNAHDAEELTQRVFVDAATALSRGDRPDSMLAWLYAVAERRFVDEVRRRARAAEFLASNGSRSERETSPDYGAPIAAAVKRGIEALPRDQRMVVVMKVLEGRSFAEIARAVKASEGACKMRFSRGIKQLQESLRQEGFAP
jgi:RNA polymerase sigma-70 factor (ECF subfamily)